MAVSCPFVQRHFSKVETLLIQDLVKYNRRVFIWGAVENDRTGKLGLFAHSDYNQFVAFFGPASIA